jgi:hypothetical protein
MYEDYTVGWICTLPIEMAGARAMLGKFHADLPATPYDDNTYILGRISHHNIVVACLPTGIIGPLPTATVATQMLSTFRPIRFSLMVGIGGGVPSQGDIRLGDVVVAKPSKIHGGVIQCAARGVKFDKNTVFTRMIPFSGQIHWAAETLINRRSNRQPTF